MGYYWFNRQKILQKAKERYSEEKAAEYYLQNREAIKEKSKNQYKNLSKEEKDKIKEYQRKRYQELIQYKKEALKNKWILFFPGIIRMSEKTLKFDKTRVSEKEFHKFKQPIDLNLINADQIVVSGTFKHIDNGFKYFIGYKDGEIVKPLCIFLPQMNGYIKYFENGGKNISIMIKNDDMLDKYNEICDKIKEKLNIKFHSMLVYDEKYIKAKVWKFDGVIKIKFLGNKIPKGNKHYTRIAYITIESVMRREKKNYLSAGLFRRMQMQNKENKDVPIHKH